MHKKSRFKLGDKVKVIEGYYPARFGDIGTVVAFSEYNNRPMITTDYMMEEQEGHNHAGIGKEDEDFGYWYMEDFQLELYDSPERKEFEELWV